MSSRAIFMRSASRRGLSAPGLQSGGAMTSSCSVSILTSSIDEVSSMRLPSSVSIWTLSLSANELAPVLTNDLKLIVFGPDVGFGIPASSVAWTGTWPDPFLLLSISSFLSASAETRPESARARKAVALT